MDIAFVIPCYNGARYLGEALSSVARLRGLARYRAALVFVDDASTDDSAAIFRTWVRSAGGSLTFRFVGRRRNGGTAAALNSGIEAAHDAAWIWPLAHDDLLIEDALEEWQWAAGQGADAMPAAYQAFGHASNGVVIDEAKSRSRRIYRVRDIQQGWRDGKHLSSGCSPFRRKWWELVGFDEAMRTAEDTLFWLRIHRLGARFVPARRPVVRVRYHAGRKSFTPVARDRRTKLRMIRERMDRPTADFLASERHFIDTLAPYWLALSPWARGAFYVPKSLRAYASSLGVRAVAYSARDLFKTMMARQTLTVVASSGDQRIAASSGRWTVYSEHGSGQCYQRVHSSYCNYPNRRQVAAFIAPGPAAARQFRAHYPKVPCTTAGAASLDAWHRGDCAAPGDGVVAISFHWNCKAVPETTSAYQYYEAVLPDLARRFDVIGHAHPRIAETLRPIYRRAGIEFVDDFDEVLRRASVYCVDNSSTLFAFAAALPPPDTRPVVVLNCPSYRKGIRHGMRFWDYADIGPQVDRPQDLVRAIEEAGTGAQSARRAEIVEAVYGKRDGEAASRAAHAIEQALERPLPKYARGRRQTERRSVQRHVPAYDNRQNGTMEKKNVRMIARVTFVNRQHEGEVRRRRAFFTTERRADALEKQGHAYRAPLPSKAAAASQMTKTAAPEVTKPASAQLVKEPAFVRGARKGGWTPVLDHQGNKVKSFRSDEEADRFIEDALETA